MFSSKRTRINVLIVIAIMVSGCNTRSSDEAKFAIRPDKRVELITKNDGDPKPFFRAALKFIDDKGKEVNDLNQEDLRKNITIKLGKKSIKPFYVSVNTPEPAENDKNTARHEILLLFDVSGSMNANDMQPNRFTAAKGAARSFLTGLPANYSVAIVPFESRNVASNFNKYGEFHTPLQSEKDLDNLPQPDNRGNTALYEAMYRASELLKKRRDDGQSQDQSLIVLTDGKNDVGHRGDDSGLMQNSQYKDLLEKLRQNNTRTFIIGLGTDLEEEKMKELASMQNVTRFYKADSVEKLKTDLTDVQNSVKNTVTICFCTYDKSLYDLRSLKFEISYKSPKGELYKGLIPWICRNSITGCVPSLAGRLNQQENNSLGSECEKSGAGAWQSLLLLFGQLAIFSGGIALLWMFVPHLMWPSIALPKLPSRSKHKAHPPTAKTPSSVSSSGSYEQATPAKPRQRFEETRIYDKPDGRKKP